jgi:prepilin-type N-terminal cleavage/methylation domain-containing protein
MSRQRGFTLVEVMIAIAIGGILLTTVFTSLSVMIRQRQNVIDFSTPYTVGPQILDAIEADFRNAYFYDTKENDGFWGADSEINGREADGISLLTSTLGHVGEQELLSNRRIGQASEAPRRRSPMSEVQYVCRQNPNASEYLELWRREDFYVDDSFHEGGIYRLVYDRVFDFKLEYVSRSTSTGGLTGSQEKAVEQMRRDGWSSIEERGLPRAVIVTVSIYAREAEKNWEHEPQVFVFRRWIPLPQVHMSAQSEGQIASWNGEIKEGAAPVPPGKNNAKDPKGGSKKPTQGIQGGRAGTPGSNPFSNALQNRAPHGGGNGNTIFGNLFKPK